MRFFTWLRSRCCFRQFRASMHLGYEFLKVGIQVVWGAWKIARLPQPVVSIFGGHLLKSGSSYLDCAHYLASRLVELDISVLTGGGPGIMEAANSGAAHQHGSTIKSMGIGVSGLKGESGFNPFVRESIMLDYFFARKYLLINYSYAFVIFPGGLGTIDELSELLNLLESEKRDPAPVILFGTEFWQPYRIWLDSICAEGLMNKDGAIRHLFVVNDSEEALKILINYCERCAKI